MAFDHWLVLISPIRLDLVLNTRFGLDKVHISDPGLDLVHMPYS